MAMYQFEFIGRDGHVDVTSDVLPDVEQARDHCRELFEGLGRLTGTRCIRLRVPRGPILYCWPEAGEVGVVEELVQPSASLTLPFGPGRRAFDTAA
jgi:hypothetical protein